MQLTPKLGGLAFAFQTWDRRTLMSHRFVFLAVLCVWLGAQTALAANTEVLYRCGRGYFRGTLGVQNARTYVQFKDVMVHRICGGYTNEYESFERRFARVKYKPVDEARITKFFADDIHIKRGQQITAECVNQKFPAIVTDISSSEDGIYVQLRYLDPEAERVCGMAAYHFATSVVEK